MRADALNLENYPVRTEITASKQIPISHVFSTDGRKLKYFLVDETLLKICSTDEEKSKGIIVDECSIDEEESECVHKNINKQQDAKNETDDEESSVTDEVLSYFKVFKCGRNILNRLDVTYEQACMVTPKEKYFMTLVETLIDYNDRHDIPLSNEKLCHSVSKVTEEK